MGVKNTDAHFLKRKIFSTSASSCHLSGVYGYIFFKSFLKKKK